MKVRMLLKSGFGPIRHGEIFDASPEDAQIGIDAGVLAPIDPPPASPQRKQGEPLPRKSFPDFSRAVVRKDSAYLARNYDSRLIVPETDHLAPRAKAALAESGGPVGGYTVPAEYAAGMMTVAAENAVIRPNATVAPMQSATLQVPYIDMTTVQSAGVSPYCGGVQRKWTGEAQTRTESEPQFKQVEWKAWELSGPAVISRPLLDDGDQASRPRERPESTASRPRERPESTASRPRERPESTASRPRERPEPMASRPRERPEQSDSALAWTEDYACQLLQPNNGRTRAVFLGAGLESGVQPRRRNWSLLGFPMYCSENPPPLGTKGDLILIDPRYYLIGDRTTLTISASDHVNFLKNQTTFRVTRRCDGQPWIEKPITLQDGATTVSPFVVLN